MTTEEILTWVFSIIGGILTFVTGGGLAKLISNVRKNGKKVNISELSKELKRNIKNIKRIKKVLDKGTEKLEKNTKKNK